MKTLTLASILFVLLPHSAIAQVPTKTAATRESRPVEKQPSTVSHALKAGEYDQAYDYYTAGEFLSAFRVALKRAQQGDPTAQTLLGRLYMEGYAVTLDGARSALWFSRAADQGDPQAELRYGLMLYNGTYVARDKEKAEAYVRKAALAEVPEAYYYYGQLLMNKVVGDEALDLGLTWFLKGAALGDADAAYAAAQMLSHGTPKITRDTDAARRLLEIAAAKDHVGAQIELAQWMLNATGGPRDYSQAFKYLYINAMRGYIPAQINLARLYRDGIGTDGDIVQAAAWYIIAQKSKMTAPDLDSLLEGMSEDQLDQAKVKADKLLQ